MRALLRASPFAIARGQTFERSCSGQRKTLHELWLSRRSVSRPGIRDFRLRMNGGRPSRSRPGDRRDVQLLQALATGEEGRHHRIATVRLPGLSCSPRPFRVGCVAVTGERKAPVLVVGESDLSDRGGHTDGGELAQARAQRALRAWASYRANGAGLAPHLSGKRGVLVLVAG